MIRIVSRWSASYLPTMSQVARSWTVARYGRPRQMRRLVMSPTCPISGRPSKSRAVPGHPKAADLVFHHGNASTFRLFHGHVRIGMLPTVHPVAQPIVTSESVQKP